MKSSLGTTVVAVAGVALGAFGVVGLSGGAAGGAPAATAKPATFQMFANVDAEGDLGSHSGAKSAEAFNGVYIVTFTKPIGHCAAVAQSGKAGGGDQPKPDVSTIIPNNLGVNPDPAHQFAIGFTGSNGVAQNTPFMLTVTCTS